MGNELGPSPALAQKASAISPAHLIQNYCSPKAHESVSPAQFVGTSGTSTVSIVQCNIM